MFYHTIRITIYCINTLFSIAKFIYLAFFSEVRLRCAWQKAKAQRSLRQRECAANLLFAFASIRLHVIKREASASGHREQCRLDTL